LFLKARIAIILQPSRAFSKEAGERCKGANWRGKLI
jgi:hypothetical protein